MLWLTVSAFETFIYGHDKIQQTNVGVVPARLLFVIPVRGAGDALGTGVVEDNWVDH